MSTNVKRIVSDIRKDGHATIEAMMERKQEFSTPMAAMLAGIANTPDALRQYNERLNAAWTQNTTLPKRSDEVVIGAGIHAAIYCATRVAMGFPKPLVIEASDRVGGIMAVSERPTFALNSRNRPGDWVGTPGTGPLNVVPGAPVQPADLSGAEYQRNSDLAFCVRSSLAMYANVVTSSRVNEVYETGAPDGSSMRVFTSNGTVDAKRVIQATGLGRPARNFLTTEDDRIMDFVGFSRRMDSMFPLRGMKRVAVVGTGDTGKVIVEALTGQGPIGGMSTAGLDYVDQIDWYGLNAGERPIRTRMEWEECNRSRYKGLGRLFPDDRKDKVGMQRDGVRVIPRERAEEVNAGFGLAYVNERPYDYVILATGFEDEYVSYDRTPDNAQYKGGRIICKSSGAYGTSIDQRVFLIGPAAKINVTGVEARSMPAGIPENSAALFRYANRTAQLAASLPTPE